MQVSRIRTLVVEDDPQCRGRMIAAAQGDPAIVLTGVLPSGAAALDRLVSDAPDVLVVGLHTQELDPIPLVRIAVARSHPGHNVLLLAHDADDCRLLPALQAGAGGCLLENADSDTVRGAIHALRAGGSPISPEVGRLLLRALQGASDFTLLREPRVHPRVMDGDTGLTCREIEILLMICKGLTIESIAAVCRISSHTVVAHLKSIYRKLRVHSRAEAVFEARQLGLM